jgi:hypothetical protein
VRTYAGVHAMNATGLTVGWGCRLKGGGADTRMSRKPAINNEDGVEDCFIARQPYLCYHLRGKSTRTRKSQLAPFDYA